MYKYVVDSSKPISSSAQLITLIKEDDKKPIAFLPGQYAAISFFRNNRPTPARCFSLVSSPLDPRVLQFSMRNKGKFTRAASQLSEGDIVNVRGPFGAFILDQDEDENTVLMAGGIGITPFMSMLRYASGLELKKDIKLIYSCRNQDDVPFAEELIKLSNQNQYIKAFFVIADGETQKLSGALVAKGRITNQILEATQVGSTKTKYYICGPPSFMKGMSKLLVDRNVPMQNIMTEAFSQGPNRQTGKIKSWPYNIYSMGALSLVLASFVVTAADLIKTLPPSTLIEEVIEDDDKKTSLRADDIDKTINALPSHPSTAPASSASITATQNSADSAANTSTVPTTTQSQPAAVTPMPVRTAPACVSTPSAPC